MSDTTDKLATALTDRPRLIGALFALCLLLSQAGTAVAGNGGSVH